MRSRCPGAANTKTIAKIASTPSASVDTRASVDRRSGSASIVNPLAMGAEDEAGDHHDDDEENPRHRAGIAHVEITPRALEEVHRIKARGLFGRLLVEEHVRLGEILKRVDHPHHEVEEDYRRQHGE